MCANPANLLVVFLHVALDNSPRGKLHFLWRWGNESEICEKSFGGREKLTTSAFQN
jgi:hypothetical protein